MEIFKHNARRLFERGMNVIPCKGKAPIIMNWTRWARERLDEATLSAWEDQYPNMNVGVVTGPASNLVCLDIDTDIIPEWFPTSCMRRRGKKGEARFFRYNGEASCHFQSAKIDLLAGGTQVILVGIHPETNAPYQMLEDEDPTETLPVGFVERLAKWNAECARVARKSNLGPATREPGRNNKLKDVAVAMINRMEPFEAIRDELLRIDAEHKPPLFTDAAEGYASTAAAGATRFLCRIMEHQARVGNVEIPVAASIEDASFPHGANIKAESQENGPKKWVPRIPTSGLLHDAYDYAMRQSPDPSPMLCLGAAIALVASICGNRFSYRNLRSNLILMGIAASGKGKSRSYLVTQHLHKYGIVGDGKTASGQALRKGFAERPLRVRFEPFDEFGATLLAMNKGGPSQGNIVETLCELFSASNGYLGGVSYSNKENSTEGCYNPCQVVFASTTPGRLKETYHHSWNATGLGPRMLFCIERSPYSLQEIFDETDAPCPIIGGKLERIAQIQPQLIDARTDQIVSSQNAISLSAATTKLVPRALLSAPGVKELTFLYETEKVAQKIKMDLEFPGSSMPSFMNRHGEFVKKLAMIHAVSMRLEETSTVEMEDVEWAIDLVEGQFKSSQDLLMELDTATGWARDKVTVANTIRSRGTIARYELMRACRGIRKRDLDEIIDSLVEGREIQLQKIVGRGRPQERYVWGEPPDVPTNRDGSIPLADA